MNTKILALAVAAVLATGLRADAQEIRKRQAPGYLGFAYQEQVYAPSFENAKLIVSTVSKDSPAEKAGIKSGDEIVRVNGLAASNGKFNALTRFLAVGDTVRLRVLRDGKERDFTIVAAPRPVGYGARAHTEIVVSSDSVRKMMFRYLDSARVHLDSLHIPSFRILRDDSTFGVTVLPFNRDSMFFKRDSTFVWRMTPDGQRSWSWSGDVGPGMVFRSFELGARSIAGAELATLDPAMIDYFKTDKGLLVLHVAPETPADRAGLQPGDVIVKAKSRAVSRIDDLRAIVAGNPETVKLEILRKGVSKEIELKTRR